MSFANTLQRLRKASTERQPGHIDNAVVQRRDLQELLYHFDRLDREVRLLYDALRAVPADGAALIKTGS